MCVPPPVCQSKGGEGQGEEGKKGKRKTGARQKTPDSETTSETSQYREFDQKASTDGRGEGWGGKADSRGRRSCWGGQGRGEHDHNHKDSNVNMSQTPCVSMNFYLWN